MIKKPKYMEKTAAEFNEIAQTIFFPIYLVITHQILKKRNVDTGRCLDIGSGAGHLAIALATLSDLTVFAMDNAKLMCTGLPRRM